MKLLSFDIEISDVFKLGEHEDMEKYAPFHISVAATAIHNGEERVWYSKGEEGRPALNVTQRQAHELLEYLDEMQQMEFMVCAWNGLGFDLRWIGYQANDMPLAARVALRSYDPMFQFFNQTGFPVALSKVAQAMGVSQEKIMNGADAPREWCEGNCEKVMDYCLGDCQITNKVIRAIQNAQQVLWINSQGSVSSRPLSYLKPVEEIIKDPEPDQSWMDNPIPRNKFFKWVEDTTKGIKA